MAKRFHMSVQASPGKHAGGHVAHIKHSLTNDEEPDVILCLVVRRKVSAGMTIEELHKMGKADALLIEPILREIVKEQGWLS